MSALSNVSVLTLAVFSLCSIGVHCQRGAFIAISPPRLRGKEDLYVYSLFPVGRETVDHITLEKKTGLPSQIVEFGTIEYEYYHYDCGCEEMVQFGCYLRVKAPKRQRVVRFGEYLANIKGFQGAPDYIEHVHVTPRSQYLDTNGVFTVTMFRDPADHSIILPVDPIGVKPNPQCRRLIWRKGGRMMSHSGPRFTLPTTEKAAGVYYIRRRDRDMRGGYAVIEVIVSDCPKGFAKDPGDESCVPSTCDISRGGEPGVYNDERCDCPNFLNPRDAVQCEYPLIDHIWTIAIRNGGYYDHLHCMDLPGARDATCKGILFCLGGVYGCKCGMGWYGSDCDRPCPRGRFGPSCTQKCTAEEVASDDCFRVLGPVPDHDHDHDN